MYCLGIFVLYEYGNINFMFKIFSVISVNKLFYIY